MGLFQKESSVGAPITVNYEAAIRALVISFLEGVPDVKTLIERIKQDLRFKLSLGFLYSDRTPSESTFSRILHTLSNHQEALGQMNAVLLKMIDQESAIFSEGIAVDATAVKVHSKPEKLEKPIISSAEDQRAMQTDEIKKEFQIDPHWGIKANSKGQNNYWHGYQAHLGVTTKTQYILSALFTSAHVADPSVAIPLMRDMHTLGIRNTHIIFDKGYDVKAIYEEAHAFGYEPIIPLKRIAKNDGEWTEDYAPTCLLENGYIYDRL